MESMEQKALKMHKDNVGKIAVHSKVKVRTSEDLTLAYSPGVAEPCKKIYENPKDIYTYTNKGNYVAVVSDGTAVLGLGDIGAEAGLPVMEGKAVLFKTFGGVDAFPICVGTKDVDEIVHLVKLLEPTFGGVNLEDISAPRCFEIEEKLKAICNIPIFHDDQHGTAIIATACLLNCLKLTHRDISEIKVVVNGAGAAAIAIAKLWLHYGVKHLILVDSKGMIYEGREGLNKEKAALAKVTNQEKRQGDLAEAMKGADIFLGVSVAGVVTKEMIKSMAKDPIILALANPVPEIMPEDAFEAGAYVVCTGRSDFPNQVNNVLAFPGIFRGALDVEASVINEEMKIAAANALANAVGENLSKDCVIPHSLDTNVAPQVAMAVAKAALETGVARRTDRTPEMVYKRCQEMMLLGKD